MWESLKESINQALSGESSVNPLEPRHPNPKPTFVYDEKVYDPLFGVQGMYLEPEKRRAYKNHLPTIPLLNPANSRANYGSSTKEHVFFNDPNYWEAYLAQKALTNTSYASPMWQLTVDGPVYQKLRPHRRWRSNATGVSESSWKPNEYDPNYSPLTAAPPKFAYSR